ncbi:MAG TPA: AIR synthase-related protein [Stellaceae bacterium]
MLSESQERMLMILAPGSEAEARRVFAKWELDFAVIGRVTETGRLVLRMHGESAADIPVGPLVGEAPLYERPWVRRPAEPDIDPAGLPGRDPLQSLKRLLACPDLASKRWIWEQYDHLVQGNTVRRPGGDAAIIRIGEGGKALALATDSTPRYCRADPVRGGAQAVAESWRNLTAVGALPLALTDNMNFGNPEKPEIMGEFVGATQGMRAACLALDYPVVSGNVSLYNETSGSAILPTPVIGGVGLIADAHRAVDLALKEGGNALILIGDTAGHLGCSLYLREIEDREAGPPPPVDLAAERNNGDFVRGQIAAGRVAACHDLGDGGLLVALAEMAMAGDRGATLDAPPHSPHPNPPLPGLDPGIAGEGADAPPLLSDPPPQAGEGGVGADLSRQAWLFGEDQGRYLLETSDPDALLREAASRGIPAQRIGRVAEEGGGAALTLPGGGAISIAELKAANEAWLPGYMAQS